eukprot:m.39944 g.39944  ORF g.39944 m.39944 type:complete len:440 (+) comp12716_c0_seq2:2-1321(+)
MAYMTQLLFAFALVSLANGQCDTCNDGYQCCDGNICCSANNQSSSICCDGKTESCCKGTCCLAQTTFCCPGINGHPDRCCPRWTVCCPGGQDGCCTPEEAQRYYGTADVTEPAAGNHVLHTLFLEVSNLKAASIEIETGKILTNNLVTGFNPWQEITRPFAYDSQREVFYYMEADFLNKPPSLDKRPLYLYTIDAATGKGKQQTVSGAFNFPAGFEYNCHDNKLYVATKLLNPQGNLTGYGFYTVDVTTAAATLISSTNASNDNAYDGWFHELSPDASTFYRLGYRDVVSEQDFGIGSTDVTHNPGATQWTGVQAAPEHQYYETINEHDGQFYSLALSIRNQSYNLLQWTPVSIPRIVAYLNNSHPLPFFGHVITTRSCATGTYIAAVVEDHKPGIVADRWAFHMVDLASGQQQTLETETEFPANEFSIAALGLPVAEK